MLQLLGKNEEETGLGNLMSEFVIGKPESRLSVFRATVTEMTESPMTQEEVAEARKLVLEAKDLAPTTVQKQ